MLRNFNKKTLTIKGGGGGTQVSEVGEISPSSPGLRNMRTKRNSKGSTIILDSTADAGEFDDGDMNE